MKNAVGVCVVVIALSGISGCIATKQGYVTRGNKLYDAGKYEDAALNYRKAIQRDPKFGEAYYHLGLAEYKLNNGPEAYNALFRAVQLLPKNVAAKEKFADVCLAYYLADPKRPQAIYNQLTQLATDLLDANANSYQGLVVRGYLASTDLNIKSGIDYFRKALRVNTSDPGVWSQLVRLLFEDGQTQEALKVAGDLINRHKSYGPIYDLLFNYYAGGGHVTEAENILKSKVANNPKEADYVVELARYYARSQKPQEAAATLQRLLADPADFPRGRLWVGDFYWGFRNYSQALQYYKEGVSASKDAAERALYQKRVIITLRAVGQKREAFELAGRVVRENPNDSEASHLHADLTLEIGKADNADVAIREFETLLKQRPNDAPLLLQLGRAYRLKGDVYKAADEFQIALAKQSNLLEARLELADIDLTQHLYPEALQQVDEVLKVRPNTPRARVLHARVSTATGKLTEARAELTSLLKESPNDNDAKLDLGFLSILEHKYSDAMDIFGKLRDTDPRASAGLATAYAAQRQMQKAQEVIQDALKKWPDSVVLQQQMATVQARNGNYDAAIAQLRALLAKNPKSVDTMRRLGDVYEAKGDHANAVSLYQQAFELVPTDVNISLSLADLLSRAGRTAEARQRYEGILKMHPENPGALNNLAFLLADSGGDLDEALRLAQRALAKFPNQPDFSDTVGYIYLKKGLTDTAVQTFGKLVQKNPQLATFHYHLGLAMFQKGDKTGARKELESALKMSTLTPQDKARVTELLAKLG